MTFWRQEGNSEKQWIRGGKFFIEKRRLIQSLINEGKSFKNAFNEIIELNNLNWEYYFRSLDSLIMWIEESDISNKTRYISLLKNSLTNDEKYFIIHLNELDKNWGNEYLNKNITFLTGDIKFNYT
ncbi:hypothetical protein AB9P05_21165 [Roseivirga sp. BDSF3-8]|uniref:hypothetical protein n=1 Tax=Roseivirga sp. BDSF3-8 TaxID=3241598 RepID=UPI00353261CD